MCHRIFLQSILLYWSQTYGRRNLTLVLRCFLNRYMDCRAQLLETHKFRRPLDINTCRFHQSQMKGQYHWSLFLPGWFSNQCYPLYHWSSFSNFHQGYKLFLHNCWIQDRSYSCRNSARRAYCTKQSLNS